MNCIMIVNDNESGLLWWNMSVLYGLNFIPLDLLDVHQAGLF